MTRSLEDEPRADGRLGALMRLFRPARTDAQSRARIQDWTRQALTLTPEDSVSISEIICHDGARPGTQTIILVTRQGARSVAYKCQGEAASRTRRDIIAALGLDGDEGDL